MGRARIVLTDVRSARSPIRLPAAQRTMLGDEQEAWLVREFEAASHAPLIVWVNTVPWITKSNESGAHGWAPYAAERRRVADAIARTGITSRLVMLSGDAHMLAIDDGANSQYSARADAPARGFIVAHAAPFDRPVSKKGGPYSHGVATSNGQYGTLDVADDGKSVSVVIQGWRGASAVSGMRLERVIR
jgi:phosphodiesterase/alkaline phosphatase D-like protein